MVWLLKPKAIVSKLPTFLSLPTGWEPSFITPKIHIRSGREEKEIGLGKGVINIAYNSAFENGHLPT